MFLRSRLILFLQGVPDFSAPKIVSLIGDITSSPPGVRGIGAFVACMDAGMVYCKRTFCVLEMYAAMLAADRRDRTGQIGPPSSLVFYHTGVASPWADSNRHGTRASGNPFFGCLRKLSRQNGNDGFSRVKQEVADQLREMPVATANATTRCLCPPPTRHHHTHTHIHPHLHAHKHTQHTERGDTWCVTG